jgi:hypothetical protein
MAFPDYCGGGFVNLIASLAAAGGAEPRHAALGLLPPSELSGAHNVVFWIVDGLGDNYLAAHRPSGKLARLRRGAISAVFPSTTATAITTSFTGATPAEHGLTGWFTYFSAAGCVAAPLPFRSRGDNLPLGLRGVSHEHLFTAPPLLDRLARRAIVVSARSIVNSDYNLHHSGAAERRAYDDLDGLVAEIAAAVRSGPERKFIYAYWPEFDTQSHRHGVGSAEARREFERVDDAFAILLERLAGTETAVVVTADHGFMDSPAEELLLLEDGPGLAGLLRLPLCGERRVAFCYVQDGRAAEFAARARDWLGPRGEVRASRELLDEGWFGPGPAHPLLAERIGDLVLVMNGRHTVKDWTPGESRHPHIGNHGGATDDEMLIPLVVAKT